MAKWLPSIEMRQLGKGPLLKDEHSTQTVLTSATQSHYLEFPC